MEFIIAVVFVLCVIALAIRLVASILVAAIAWTATLYQAIVEVYYHFKR